MPPKPTRRRDLALRRVLHLATMRRVFIRLLPRGTTLLNLHIENRGSFTFKRAVLYDLTLRARDGRLTKWLVRGNVPSQDRSYEGPIGYQTLRLLRRRGFAQPPFEVAKPLVFLPSLRLLLYENVAGVVAHQLLRRRSANTAQQFERIGAWLRRLHSIRSPSGRRPRLRDVRQDAHYFYDDFRRFSPGMLERVTPLLEQLVRLRERHWDTGQRRARLTHGDFKPANLILQKRSVVAIDFGNSLHTDPYSDVGNFRAQLRMAGWRSGIAPALLRNYDQAFLRGYLARQRLPKLDQERLRVWEAWWQMQLLAYSLSTMPLQVAVEIIEPSLRSIERALRRFGYLRAPWDGDERSFSAFLQDERWLRSFFRAHLLAFFPGAVELVGLTAKFPSAFSDDSRLVRITLDLQLRDGNRQRRVVRGNRVGLGNLSILKLIGRRSSLLVQRPLWHSPASGFLFYEELPGTTLRNIPFRTSVFRPIVRALGVALAKLHRIPASRVPALTAAQERCELKSIRWRITKARFPGANRLTEMAGRLERWQARWWNRLPQVVSHNDFQASNILLCGPSRVGIIDFSRSGRGPLPIDAAQFLTHMTVMLAPSVRPAGIRTLRRAFLNTYRRRLPARWRQVFDRALPAFELRTALDIIAISCDHLNPATRDRVLKPLLSELPRLSL